MGKSGGIRRGVTRRLVVGAFAVVAALAGTVVALPTAASAAGGTTCLITPALRDVTVNQGLGSYATLTRGKDTLVRAYLSLPQTMPTCAGSGAYVQITGGSLVVSGGTATTVTPSPAPASPYAQVATFASAPAVDTPADLKFVVPGTAFDSTVTTPYTASFSLTISYQSAGSKAGTLTAVTPVTFTTLTGSTAPITKQVGAPSNNLRVLVVPIGNKSDTSGAQFPTTATTSVQNGMTAVSRIMPVRRGIGDLTVAGNGLRYSLLPPSSMIDAGPAGLNLMASGKLCIEPLNTWPRLSSQLATFLQDWNTANPTSPADRAVGVVWQDVSAGAEANCYEGISDVNGTQAMTRVYSDSSSTSDTGALIGHELLHTFGGAHSLNTAADRDAPNRAYNVTTRQFLAVNRSVMNTSFDASYTNTSTLFESGAYALAQCALTPGAAGCTNPGAVGVAGAGGPALVVTGSTCGTSAACTKAISLFDGDMQPRTIPSPGSTYSLVQLNGTTPIMTTPVPVPCSQENDAAGGGPATTNPVCNISLAVTWEAGADRFELRNGSTVLYSAANDGIAPSFLAALRTLTTSSLANYTNAAGDDLQPSLCSNGALVAWVDGGGIRVRRVDKSTPASAPLAGAEPAFSADCSQLVYSSGGELRTVNLAAGTGAPDTASVRTIYGGSLLDVLGLFTAPASHPWFAADGRIVAAINDDIYVMGPGGVLPPSGATCTIPLLNDLFGVACAPIVATSAVEKNPTVSATGEVAYDSGSDIRIASIDGSNQRAFITNASLASFGGPVVNVLGEPRQPALFVRGGSVWAHDTDGNEAQLTTGADTHPALDGSGTTFAIDRTTSGQHDVWIGTLSRVGVRATVYDNNIGNVTLAVFVNCGGTRILVQDPVAPVSVDTAAGTATYVIGLDPATVCAGGVIELRASDGWLTSTVTDGTAGGPHDPTPNIYSLPEGTHLLQFDSWAFAGGATDPDQSSSTLSLTWTITGYAGTFTGPNPPDVQPPTGGFTPGTYTVKLCVTDSTGRTTCTQHTFVVDPDADHDGIVASKDKTCGGVNADNDPSNAGVDYDGDGIVNRDDPQLCSAPNATVTLTPSVVNVNNDTGNPINATISTTALNLTTVVPSTVKLTAIGGVPLSPPLVAYVWSATATTASAKFDRATVDKFLRDNNLIGSSITFTVTGSNGTASFLGTGTTSTCSGSKCPMS